MSERPNLLRALQVTLAAWREAFGEGWRVRWSRRRSAIQCTHAQGAELQVALVYVDEVGANLPFLVPLVTRKAQTWPSCRMAILSCGEARRALLTIRGGCWPRGDDWPDEVLGIDLLEVLDVE